MKVLPNYTRSTRSVDISKLKCQVTQYSERNILIHNVSWSDWWFQKALKKVGLLWVMCQVHEVNDDQDVAKQQNEG